MISDDHIPQIPLDHHDSIFKLPCGGKESPKGIQKIVATQVSPQSEMVSMSDVGAWHFNGATNSFTLPWSSWSNFSHGEPWPLDASSLHWGTWHLQIAHMQHLQNLRIRRSMDDQLMISWWSVDDLRGTVELSEAATEGIAEGLWANSGAVVLAGSSEIPPFLATKSQLWFLKNMHFWFKQRNSS